MSAIGTKRTSASALHMSALGGNAGILRTESCLLLTHSGHPVRAFGCPLAVLRSYFFSRKAVQARYFGRLIRDRFEFGTSPSS